MPAIYFIPNEIHPDFINCINDHGSQLIYYKRTDTAGNYVSIAMCDRINNDGYIFTVGKTYTSDTGKRYTITKINLQYGLIHFTVTDESGNEEDIVAGLLITRLNTNRTTTRIPWSV